MTGCTEEIRISAFTEVQSSHSVAKRCTSWKYHISCNRILCEFKPASLLDPLGRNQLTFNLKPRLAIGNRNRYIQQAKTGRIFSSIYTGITQTNSNFKFFLCIRVIRQSSDNMNVQQKLMNFYFAWRVLLYSCIICTQLPTALITWAASCQ